MPMNKAAKMNKKIYGANIYVNGDRVYDLTTKSIFVESYLDRPRVSAAEFWKVYAYSGEADKWFPHIDPESITFEVSPGQYDVGIDVRAYGKLTGDHKELIQEIRDALYERDLLVKSNAEVEKKIKALEKTKVWIPRNLSFAM